MEIVFALLLVIAVPIVLLGATRGAQAAQREREARWARVPASPSRAPAPVPLRAADRDRAQRLRSALIDRARSAPIRAPATREPPARAGTRERPARAGTAVESTAPAVADRPARAPIDLNSASLAELGNLPGVGVRAAERIVAHRERHGPFASVADLAAVEGFDQHRISRLAPRAKV
jgi:competence protein ComEA